MRLRLTDFNRAYDTKSKELYRWTGEKWEPLNFPEHVRAGKRAQNLFGIDIEESYDNFINYLRGGATAHR